MRSSVSKGAPEVTVPRPAIKLTPRMSTPVVSLSKIHVSNGFLERFHHGRGLFLLFAVATGFYMLKVPNWESLPPKYEMICS